MIGHRAGINAVIGHRAGKLCTVQTPNRPHIIMACMSTVYFDHVGIAFIYVEYL